MKHLREEIAKVAYELYEKRGRGHGRHCDDWLEAEKIVLARHAKGTEKGAKPETGVKRKAVERTPKEKGITGEGKELPKKRTTARKAAERKKTL